MEPLGEAVAVTVDVSLSLREKDFKPSRIHAARQASLKLVKTLLERDIHTLVGLIVFYKYAFPLLDLTYNNRLAEEAVEEIKVLGEATSPGLAVGEAVDMLRHAPTGYGKRIVMVTDGTFNEGVELDVAAGLAARSGVTIDVLSFGNLSSYDREMIEIACKKTGGVWLHASNMEQLLGYAAELGYRVPGGAERRRGGVTVWR